MQVAKDMERMKEEKEFKIRTHQQRAAMVKKTIAHKDKEQLKMNIFLMKRWDFIKERKQEYHEFLIQKMAEEDRGTTWAKNVHFLLIMRKIFNIFDQKRIDTTYELKSTFCVQMLKIKFKLKQKKKRPSLEEREMLTAKQ